MKKIFGIFIALFLAIVMVFGVAGCNTGTQNDLQGTINDLQSQIAEMEGRLAEMEDQIRERDETIENLNDQITKLEEQIEQLEKELAEKSAGTFYTLQEAYNNGWLTQADLMSIACYHNGGQRYNEEIMSDDYKPAPKTPEILSKNVDLAIRQTLVNDLNKEYDSDSFVLNNIVVCAYYGTYNGGAAIRMVYSVDGESGLNDVISENTVANVKFRYTDYTNFFQLTNYTFTNAIMIWKGNS